MRAAGLQLLYQLPAVARRDVEGKPLSAIALGLRDELWVSRWVARGRYDDVAVGQGLTGQGQAEAGRTARDEPGRWPCGRGKRWCGHGQLCPTFSAIISIPVLGLYGQAAVRSSLQASRGANRGVAVAQGIETFAEVHARLGPPDDDREQRRRR